MGVRRAKRTTLKARGPDITLKIARPVSVFINLPKEKRKREEERDHIHEFIKH
jgi:hypothetical protein